MTAPKTRFKTIDQYISTFPKNVQEILEKLRATFKKVAPEATEAISYQMPTFKLNGNNLIHFAAYPTHVGIYALSDQAEQFKEQLGTHMSSKGAIKYFVDEEIPYDLIEEIVMAKIEDSKTQTVNISDSE